MTEGQLRAVLHDGYQLLRQGRYAQAVALADRACADQPDNAHLLELASEARLANGDPQAAVDRIARAAAVAASPVPLLIKYASLLLQLRRRREARLVAGQAQAQALAGADGAAWWRIGALYSGCHEVAAARDAYRHAMTWLGEQPGLLYDLATMQFFGGEFDAAEVTLERLLQLAPETGDALYLRATLRRQTGQHNHLDDLRHRLTTLSDPSARAAGLYALSKELEDLGRHAESFETLTAAAACKRKTLQYDVAAECAHIAQIREAYAPDALRALQPGDAGEGAVFIVGLPRSGTTLLERLLIQRGGARSAGELMDFGALLGSATSGVLATNPGLTAAQASLQIDFAALGEEYLRGACELVHDHPVVIDKMPVNYLYCGMIATALPRARIIHLVRDPLDTCYAMYKTLFYNAYPFSYALDELADYYLAYQQTMRHWHAVLPGGILDVHYEELVRDTEHQISRVLSWCGLTSRETITGLENVPFVTASAAQVRGDVHQRSVHSSRRHLDGLMPLLKRLRAAGVALPGVEVA